MCLWQARKPLPAGHEAMPAVREFVDVSGEEISVRQVQWPRLRLVSGQVEEGMEVIDAGLRTRGFAVVDDVDVGCCCLSLAGGL